MTQTLTIRDDDKRQREQLEKSISQKRKKLSNLQARSLRLQKELTNVQKLYETRIGRLYMKDNQLDLEIIKLKNITKLIVEGVPGKQAIDEIEDLYKNFFSFTPDEHNSFSYNFSDYTQNRSSQIPNSTKKNLKNLWKKLLFQFHPDLVSNPSEKQKREEIMKRINKAYKTNNYEALKLLESQYYVEDFNPGSIEQLELVLVEIENVILILERQYKRLRSSEWYAWKLQMDKAAKKNNDIFAELEKSLLHDIVSKTKICDELKKSIMANPIDM